MAYVIENKKKDLSKIESYLPLEIILKNKEIAILQIASEEKDFLELHRILNDVIKEGISYPQENTLNYSEFKAYYLSHEVFILKFKENKEVIGSFYIKPNFPGRCDHFCNGGFIVDKKHRGLGAGKIMGFHYLRLANLLGYKSSFFNLVFSNNPVGLKLWRSLGFKEMAVIPNVCRVKNDNFSNDKDNEFTYVDGNQFYYDLKDVDFEEKLIL